MLAGLTLGDRSALEQEHLAEARASKEKERERKKKHKKDKSKKHKKEKTRKRKEKGHSSSGSEGSDSGSEDEWLKQQQRADNSEGSPAAADNAGKGSNGLQREDWMTVPMSRSLGFDQDEKPAKEDKAAEPEEAPVVAGIRYKNPEQEAAAAERAAAREAAAAAGGGSRGPVSAAAGVSWRMKAVQRAQQLAKEQGRDVNTVLSERWGSAADIAKGLIDGAATAAAEGGQPSSRHHSNNRGPAAGSRNGGPAPHYLSGVRSEQAAMKRPAGLASGSKLSWRRPAAAAEESRDRGRHIDRDRSRERESSRDRGRGDTGGVAARGTEDRDRDRGHDRHRDRDEGRSDSGRRDGREGDHRYSADRRDRRDKSPEQRRRSSRSPDRRQQQQQDGPERGRGDHDRAADRHGDGRDRQQGDWGRDRHQNEQRHDRRQQQQQLRRGDTDGGRGRGSSRHEQQQERQKAEVVEALKAVAGHINTYSNDGSFMQQFAQQQPQEDEQPADDSGPDSNQEQQQQQQQPDIERPSAPPAAAAAGSNRSTAELLRARLAGKAAAGTAGDEAPAAAAAGGNKSVAEALRARLAGKAPAAGAAAAPASGTSSKAEVVQLPLIDASGRAMPGAFGRESAAAARRQQELAAGGRVNKRVQRYGADGQRERYFADDDNVDLQALVKRAKHGDDALDLDRTMAGNIAARSRFKETDLDADAEYDYDAGLDLSESRRKRGDVQQQRQRERQRQIAQFNRTQRLEDKCTYCFSSTARPKELAIAVGQTTYLSFVQRGRLVDGHCCIVPAEHVASTRQVDDNTWTEVRNFQKCLIRMFMEAGQEVLFLETATNLGTGRNHAIMECIPVPPEAFAKAPMYFKKALQEAESEWSQHASKAVIDTKAKGLRGSVPPNFPYMYIQFGYANGFVHVIDDESKFDKDLGRQVIVGLLKLPAEVMHRKQRADAPQVQANMAAALRKQFAPFDWTKALD